MLLKAETGDLLGFRFTMVPMLIAGIISDEKNWQEGCIETGSIFWATFFADPTVRAVVLLYTKTRPLIPMHLIIWPAKIGIYRLP